MKKSAKTRIKKSRTTASDTVRKAGGKGSQKVSGRGPGKARKAARGKVRKTVAKTAPKTAGRRTRKVGTLTVTELARVLSAAGGQRVTAKMIRDDLAAGAPVNADGTVSLIRYAAWLAGRATKRVREATRLTRELKR